MASEDDGQGVRQRARPIEVSPLVDQQELDADLDKAARVARFRRTERWENYRQILVLATFTMGAIAILAALVFSAYCIMVSTDPDVVARSQWVWETFVGALIAGFIAFWAVKSFER